MKPLKPILFNSTYFDDNRGKLIKNYSKERKGFTQEFLDSYISISKKNVFKGALFTREVFYRY